MRTRMIVGLGFAVLALVRCSARGDLGFVPDAGPIDAGLEASSVDAQFPDVGSVEAGKPGCSGDLRDVLDGDGKVIATCPPTQGCANGQCVPACQAAATSKGSLGCDYVVPSPALYSCFAVFIANNWPTDVKPTLSRGGTSYDVSTFGRIAGPGGAALWAPIPGTGIPSGKVAVIFLSGSTCPITTPVDFASIVYSGPPARQMTGRGAAWHISLDAPVTTYDILPFGGAGSALTSAELVYPTTAWGTNYLGIVPVRGVLGPQGFNGPQWGQVIASEDGTQVQVLANVDLPGGPGVPAAPTNVPTSFTLKAGEYLQWQESNDMSGTIIQSTKPVSFIGGNSYACYRTATSKSGGCDATHQQIPPVSAFGSVYAVAPYATRRADLLEESIAYRIVGAVAGTSLTFAPPIPNAPKTLGAGEVADFEATSAFVVSSDDNHPFYVAQLMGGSGLTTPSRSGSLGDEEFVNVIPPAQYLSKYVFYTDYTYGTTNLVFTRKKSGSFADVKLDCVGTLSGWKPLGTSGDYEYTDVDLVRTGKPNGSCTNGPHVAESTLPFGLTVWGLENSVSYAYPAGGNLATVNSVVILPTPK